MRRQLSIVALVLCFVSHIAGAAEKATPNQTTLKIEDAANKKNKVDGDLDQEITNAKLRAESGSKSKASVSTTVNYKGGSVSRPFGAERPDLSGLPDNQVDTSLDATVRGRYRPDKNSSFTAGASLGMKTPFHGDINANENQVNVSDPLLGYNRTFAALDLQNSWNIVTSIGTSDESKNVERIGSIGTDYTLLKKIDRLSMGLTASIWYDFYSTEPGQSDNRALKQRAGMQKVDKRVDWGATATPTFEFAMTDKLTLRALFAYFRWKHMYGDGENWRLLRIKEYNSVGVGIALIRDVYLYPNVQFLPRDAKLANTNVGLSATINVF